MGYGAIEMKLQFFFPKIESFKSNGSISRYKEWPDWEDTSVGVIPWYEYKCFLCTICGGNDEELANCKVLDFSVHQIALLTFAVESWSDSIISIIIVHGNKVHHDKICSKNENRVI